MLGWSGVGSSSSRSVVAWAAAGLAVLSSLSTLEGGLLYFTDFENFQVGEGEWVGTDDWIGVNAGKIGPEANAPQGIDNKFVENQGQTAYLGFEPPTANFVSVSRDMNHDPLPSGTDVIQFEALVGIEDSKNLRYDHFLWTFYNIDRQFLAAIWFSNVPATFGIWWENGGLPVDTGEAFVPGELQLLYVEIDLLDNRWQAELGGRPLFANRVFNTTGASRTLGPVAAQWQLGNPDPAFYGDNWMLVAGMSVWAVPFGEIPFNASSAGWSETGEPMISFTGEVGWNYQVEYSDDMVSWHGDLPGSFFNGYVAVTPEVFTDTTRGPSDPVRYYRVVRSVTP